MKSSSPTPHPVPLDHIILKGRSDDIALIIKDEQYSYERLNLYIGRFAFWLRSQNVNSGDRVACWSGKGIIACIMPIAAARAGLIYVPINPLLKAGQVAHIMHDSGAKLIIANKGRLAALNEHDENIENFAIYEEQQVFAALQNDIPSWPMNPGDLDVDSLCAILYTSGSTGRPKGVMLSHANLTLGAQSVAHYLAMERDDVTLAVLPLSFDYGQNQLFSTWYAGGAVVPLDYLLPRDVVKACEKYCVTTLAAVPPLWVQLVEQHWPEEAVRHMRRLTNSGGALTQNLVQKLRSFFPKSKIFAMYGLTEAFRSTFLDPDLIDTHPTSMGRAIPFAEIMVVNKNGEKAAPDEEGELVHAGPLVAKGYWQDAKRTSERFRPAPDFSEYGAMAVWSGDTVKRAADGLLYFMGRDDAMIKVSGNRVSPTEIEEIAIASHIAAEACAIGRKDEKLGEAIILFVRAVDKEAGDNQDKLSSYLRQNLPNFMQPQEMIWLDIFPKNANGKLDRTALIEKIQG
ncbi:acyl-CoA ligase (AMP-forming), exosortase A system-associated [Sphingorhabdus lutea]|uniref:Acyl-CoA ligase (AMP-forming), exosortase A system-associated n=1 Tax=Sphingorhabdus lutea TaxID=1913578 RepID=A0A1L3JBF3_9SPHN|nr:acyl-CoA ligase (AMP-forming), exosortase A system-associated [Sphingorhabdus lutea]APG62448.1 acyl-CoA ligase (AMP-forming), exosortase A system-associated [Sphingorhabdus lutea]